jgi:hypothetical protein
MVVVEGHLTPVKAVAKSHRESAFLVWVWRCQQPPFSLARKAFSRIREVFDVVKFGGSGLSLRPSEYVRRQMRFTPYPTEDVGWIIEQAGPEVCMFSSDYPHVEGGRRPIERFEASLDGTDAVGRERFYRDNFLDLMGTAGAALAS